MSSTRAGFVAIAGRPNVGKSTILNRVLKSQLSIVTPKAQTTRERVLGILTEPKKDGGSQIVFVDTPGIHRAKEGGINEYMVNEAREALVDVSAVWYLVDPRSELEHEEPVLDILKTTQAPVYLVMNKSDIFGKKEGEAAKREALTAKLLEAAKARGIRIEKTMLVAAQPGKGVGELLELTAKHLPESPFYYPDPEQISDRPVRFFVGEKIREQLLMCLGDELPYSCAVQIEKYDENAKPVPRIEAVIYVERDSQKGIVVGKGGAKIKEIGQGARQQIERFVGGKVFLGLQVKVLKDWTRDPERLKQLGYNLPAKNTA